MRQKRLYVSSLLVLGLLGPGGLVPSTLAASDNLPPLTDVPFYRADELRSSIEVGPGPTSQPQLAWEHVLDSSNNGDPILVGGPLIVADQDDHLVVLDVEGLREHFCGVERQPREELAVGPRDARRCLLQTLTIGVLADGDEQLAHRGLGPWLVDHATWLLCGHRCPMASVLSL